MNDRPRLLTQSCDARSMGCHAEGAGWLSPAEQDEFARLRDIRRRNEWLAARFLLKGMLQRSFAGNGGSTTGIELCNIEILSRDVRGRGQPPRVLLAGRLLSWHVSLAHQDGIVWAAVSVDPDVRVGIDVVPAEPMDLRGDDLWFTPGEVRWLRQSNDPLLGTTLWAVKEAVYKATNRGEPFVPARIDVAPDAAGGFTWSRHGIPCVRNDSVSVARLNRTIVVVASVCREAEHD